MKLLLKKVFRIRFINFLKKQIDPRPFLEPVVANNNFSSYSDCFPWRTDNGFKTIFKFFDLIKLFYNLDNNNIKINIYSKNYNLLKKVDKENIEDVNEFLITKELVGLEDYGFFNIFHQPYNFDIKLNKVKLSDKSYVGFFKNTNIPSFVHGNIPIKMNFDDSTDNNLIFKSIFINKKYYIQSSFKETDFVELFFTNPTSKNIELILENNKYFLKPHNSIILKIRDLNKIIKIRSNCSFLRPYVFSYKKKSFDCFHS